MLVYSLETIQKIWLRRSIVPQWYEHEPDRVIENKVHKILWDFTIQWNIKIGARLSDIVVIDKTKKEDKIVDVAIPGDVRMNERKVKAIEKYKILQDEITRMWNMKKLIIVAVVVDALAEVATGFEKYDAATRIEMKVEHTQKKQPYWEQQGF